MGRPQIATPPDPLLPPLPVPPANVPWWQITPTPMQFENIEFSRRVEFLSHPKVCDPLKGNVCQFGAFPAIVIGPDPVLGDASGTYPQPDSGESDGSGGSGVPLARTTTTMAQLLACAECNLGPLGWCKEGGTEFWLACSRVRYNCKV